MTSGRLHIWFGLGLSALAAVLFYQFLEVSLSEIPTLIFIIFTYSQLPDIDHKMSNITWSLLLMGVGFLWIGFLYNNPIPLLSPLIPADTTFFGMHLITLIVLSAWWLPHRGPTHTIWFCLLSPLLLLLIPHGHFNNHILLIAAGLACYSHLLADGYIFKLSLKPKFRKKNESTK